MHMYGEENVYLHLESTSKEKKDAPIDMIELQTLIQDFLETCLLYRIIHFKAQQSIHHLKDLLVMFKSFLCHIF